MKRLTERDGTQYSFIACRDCVKPHCTDCEEFRKQAATLAAYEETGATPKRVAELAIQRRNIEVNFILTTCQKYSIKMKKLIRYANYWRTQYETIESAIYGICDFCIHKDKKSIFEIIEKGSPCFKYCTELNVSEYNDDVTPCCENWKFDKEWFNSY